MTEQPKVRPYESSALCYLDSGWSPLPIAGKYPPPNGYTGNQGAWPSRADVLAWIEDKPALNVGLRLPQHVLGIDVDHYAGKSGKATLEAAIDRWGELPATWISTSRDDGTSGIRLFGVPEGMAWPSELPGGGVEIIRFGHRYCMAAPSIHPEGREYRWITPDGQDAGQLVPHVDELPHLPAAWVVGLTGGEASVDVARADLTDAQADAWLAEHGQGELCESMQRALDAAASGLGSGASRHEAMTRATSRIILLIQEGHRGGSQALTAVRAAFGRATEGEHRPGEFDRAVAGAVRLAAGRGAVASPCLPGVFGCGVSQLQAAPLRIEQAGAPIGAAPTELAECASALRFPAINWDELWAAKDEEEWIVRPLLPARRAVALYSAPKVGKSLLMLELAAGVASGRTVLGHTPERARRVLYVDFENDPVGDVRQRLISMGYGPADLSNLCYLSFPSMAKFDNARGGEELIQAVQEHHCEVVVIDTVSRAVEGEENVNDTWLNLYKFTGMRLKALDVAVVRLDHTGKDESKGMRGGSAKVGDVDAVWKLSMVTKDKTYRLECTDHRMRVPEKTLLLHRKVTPYLHHVVDTQGRSGSYEAKIAEIIRIADEAALPLTAGRDAIKYEAQQHGVKAGTDLYTEAASRRKNRTPADQKPPGQVAALTTPNADLAGGGQVSHHQHETPNVGVPTDLRPAGQQKSGDLADPDLNPATPMGAGSGQPAVDVFGGAW